MKNGISSSLFILYNLFPVFLVAIEFINTLDLVFIYILENVVIVFFSSGRKYFTLKYIDTNTDTSIYDIVVITAVSLIFCFLHSIIAASVFNEFLSISFSKNANFSYFLLIFLSLIFLHGFNLFEEYKETNTIKDDSDSFNIFSPRIILSGCFVMSIPMSNGFIGVTFGDTGMLLFFIACKFILELHLINKEKQEEREKNNKRRISMPFEDIPPEAIKALELEFSAPQLLLNRRQYLYTSFSEMKKSREYRLKMVSERMVDLNRAKQIHSYIEHQAKLEYDQLEQT